MKKCLNCEHYLAFYTKGFGGFDKRGNGVCTFSEKEKAVKQTDGCKDWISNSFRESICSEMRLQVLDQALQSILELKAILGEWLKQ